MQRRRSLSLLVYSVALEGGGGGADGDDDETMVVVAPINHWLTVQFFPQLGKQIAARALSVLLDGSFKLQQCVVRLSWIAPATRALLG